MSPQAAEKVNARKNRKRGGVKRTPAKSLRSKEQVIELYRKSAKPKTVELTDEDREALVLEYRTKARKLARSILRKWHSRMDLEEVDSVVDLSLCEAVRRYNPAKGASFMTFMFYHLRGNLIRAVTAAATANAVPANAEKEEGDNSKKPYRAANAIEIAEALSGHESVLPDELVFKSQLVKLSLEACTKLDALEREVIERIYLKEEQLMDIAGSLGYSRCHISRVKKKALETLSQYMNELLADSDGKVEAKADSPRLRKTIGRRKIHRRRPRARVARGTEAAYC